MAKYKIAWLPGDGIGRDVMEAARLVLERLALEDDLMFLLYHYFAKHCFIVAAWGVDIIRFIRKFSDSNSKRQSIMKIIKITLMMKIEAICIISNNRR